MTVFIQHSYGKSDKIVNSIEKDLTSGVIFSPKGESTPMKMIETIKEYTEMGVRTYFDPHFQLGLIENCPDCKIKDYPYYKSSLKYKDFVSPKNLLQHVNTCLNFQKNLNVTGLISPTCIIESFEDKWCGVAMQMAQGALEYASENNVAELYITFVISDNAFLGSKDSLDDFITTITSFDNLDKIYLIINKSLEAYSPQIESDKLQNILYLIYSLSVWNNIKIICGYSDIIGLTYLSAGAEAITTGWSQKSRFFCRGNYKEMHGGSLPKPRYMSLPLLNSINITPELNQIKSFGLIDKILSGTEYDNLIIQTPVAENWSQVSFYHHINSLNLCSKNLLLYEVDKRIEIMQTRIEHAIELYNELKSIGVPFAQHTNDTHLYQWRIALDSFKEMIQ